MQVSCTHSRRERLLDILYSIANSKNKSKKGKGIDSGTGTFLYERLLWKPLHSLTTGDQEMPFQRKMCCDIVSLNLQVWDNTLL